MRMRNHYRPIDVEVEGSDEPATETPSVGVLGEKETENSELSAAEGAFGGTG